MKQTRRMPLSPNKVILLSLLFVFLFPPIITFGIIQLSKAASEAHPLCPVDLNDAVYAKIESGAALTDAINAVGCPPSSKRHPSTGIPSYVWEDTEGDVIEITVTDGRISSHTFRRQQ